MLDTPSLSQTRNDGETHPSDSDRNIITAAKGGSIVFVGKVFGYLSSFVFAIVLARFLGTEQLGLYALALSVTGIVTALSLLGLNGGVARYLPIALERQDEARAWGIIQTGTGVPVLVGLVLTFVLLLIADPLANHVFHEPAVVPVLRLISLTIPLAVLRDCLSAIAQGFKQVQYEVYSQEFAFTIIKLILSIALLVLGLRVMGVALAYVVGLTIGVVMLLYSVHHLFPLNRPLNTAQRNAGEMFRFSLPLYLSRLLNRFSTDLETLVLGAFGVAADVGVYSAVLRLSAIGNMFYESVKKISVPVISELYSQGKMDALERFYQTTTKWAISVNLPIFLTLVLFADPLLAIFGKDFAAGSTGLIILAAAALFNASVGASGTVINMTGHSRLSFLNSIIYLVVTVALDLVFISRWRLIGAAWAGALTTVVNNTLRMIEVYILVHGLLPFNPSFFKLPVAGLLAAGVTYLLIHMLPIALPIVQCITLIPILWITYGAALWALRLSDEDRMIIGKFRDRFRKRWTRA